MIQATSAFKGTIQVANNPGGPATEAIYDAAAGVYANGAEISGSVSGTAGSYTLAWKKAGVNTSTVPLVMFALPHHVQSFDQSTAQAKAALQLQTTTKGVATAVLKDSWTMVENNMPIAMDFAPWKVASPYTAQPLQISARAIDIINSVSASEISQDMNGQTSLDSMYFSGKALSKFATIIYTVNDILKNPGLAQTGLTHLKTAFAVFVQNKQKYPLVYETAWKGVVSTGSYVTGDCGQDFGNTYYNDHHFHYGYFIHAAAIIGYLDPSWLATNKDWVNLLVRDVSA